jgi:thiamine transporter
VFLLSASLKRRENIRALSETAMLVAIGFALSFITFVPFPQGGAVTALSTLPLLLIGLRHGLKWGLLGGLAYACLELTFRFFPPPTATPIGYIAVVFLDYIIAFTVLGLSGLFSGNRYGLLYAAPICLALRFLSHFFSGILIWGVFAENLPVWLFSLIYNGSYMGVELVLTMIVGTILLKTAPMIVRNTKAVKDA